MPTKLNRPTLYPWLFDVHAYICCVLALAIVVLSAITLLFPKASISVWLSAPKEIILEHRDEGKGINNEEEVATIVEMP